MQSIHPDRKRALLYVGLLLILITLIVGLSIVGNQYPQSSSMNNKLLGTAGLSALLLALFSIPFISFAIKHWKFKLPGSPLPPPDAVTHSLSVRFSTSFPSRFIGNVFGTRGSLNWVNSEKIIRLTAGQGEQMKTIFEVPYNIVQKLDVNLNLLSIKVNGKTYACTPSNNLGDTSTLAGVAMDNQMATITIETMQIQSSGIPELADRLRAEGVMVTYAAISKAFELSFDIAFAILLISVLCIGTFVIH